MNETILVRRAKQGDAQAFEELLTLYEKKVYSLAYHYVGNEHDAMDISQEAFLRVYRFCPNSTRRAVFQPGFTGSHPTFAKTTSAKETRGTKCR